MTIHESYPHVTLSLPTLHHLLRPVLPAAGTDDMLPILCAVHLEVTGGWLYATATDRFRMVMHRVPVIPAGAKEGSEEHLEAVAQAQGFEAIVSTADLRGILALWPGGKGAAYRRVRLTSVPNDHRTADHRGLVAADPESRQDRTMGPVRSYGAAHLGGKFPKVANIVRAALEDVGKPAKVGNLGVNPALLAELMVCARYVAGPAEAVVVRAGSTPRKPVMLYAGTDWIGLLMPRRMLASAEDAPPLPELAHEAEALEAWRTHLNGAAAELEESA